MLTLRNSQQRWIVWTLKAIVACQLIGAAGEMRVAETPLFKLIAGHPDEGALDWGETPALQSVEITSLVLLAIAGITLIRPYRWVMFLTAGWFLLDALLSTYLKKLGGEAFALVPVTAHAARFAAPLALGMLRPRHSESLSSSSYCLKWEWIIRLATAFTFATHGYEAWMLNRVFIDYLIIFSHYFPAGHLEQATAETILRVIGVVDLIVAGLILLARSRALALYMTFWGVLTAFSRIVCEGGDPLYADSWLGPLAQGWDYAWYKTVIRSANGGLPAVLFLYWTFIKTPPDSPPEETPHEDLPLAD